MPSEARCPQVSLFQVWDTSLKHVKEFSKIRIVFSYLLSELQMATSWGIVSWSIPILWFGVSNLVKVHLKTCCLLIISVLLLDIEEVNLLVYYIKFASISLNLEWKKQQNNLNYQTNQHHHLIGMSHPDKHPHRPIELHHEGRNVVFIKFSTSTFTEISSILSI